MIYRIIFNIQEFFREIKYFFQRGRRGYSDRDLWDINEYLATIIPPMMRYLKENGTGCPAELIKNNSREKWEEILEDIARGFDEYSNVDKYGLHSEFSKKIMDEGMKLFIEYFGHYWD